MSAGPWLKLAFMAMVTNFLPILAIENQTNYDGERLLNATLAITAGMIAAALSIDSSAPATARRTRRLLALTLRDLRRWSLAGSGSTQGRGSVSSPAACGHAGAGDTRTGSEAVGRPLGRGSVDRSSGDPSARARR